MINKLKDLYLDLAEVLISAKVPLWDTDLHGPGVVISVVKLKYVVVLGGNRTWKSRIFTMAHEMGHIFYMYEKNGKSRLKLRSGVSSEREANLTACKILDVVDPKLKVEYARFYNKLNKGSKRKKFEVPK